MSENWNFLTSALFLWNRLVDNRQSQDKINAKCMPSSEPCHSGSEVFWDVTLCSLNYTMSHARVETTKIQIPEEYNLT
jgi:hypothetical protein